MSDALRKMLEEETTPTPGAARATPNARLLDHAKGDVGNARSFREARALDEINQQSVNPMDPERAMVSDLVDMQRIVDEEMAKMLPPEDVRAVWAQRVEKGEFRTWMLPKHKAARFPIGAITGNIEVGTFRKHIQAAVIGDKGGSIHSVIRTSQFTGRWEPYDYYAWRGLMGGGTIVDVDRGQAVGTTSPSQQLFLTVQFVEISGSDPVTYDAKGNANTDLSRGGEATRELVTVMKQMHERMARSDAPATDTSALKTMESENLSLKAQMGEIQAMLAKLLAEKEEPPRRSPAQLANDIRMSDLAKARAKAASGGAE